MQELIRLHKIFCLAQHPLWTQVASRFWKRLAKYWSPDVQVANKDQWEVVFKEVQNKLLRSDLIPAGSVFIDEKYLIDLMNYYGIECFYSGNALDRVAFNAVLAFVVLKFVPVLSVHLLCVLGIACFNCFEYGVNLNDGISQHLPVVREENDFLIWLYNNFTKLNDVKDGVLETCDALRLKFEFNEKIPDNKKVLLNCRETFNRLLKLKNSEFRTKKIHPIVKSGERPELNRRIFQAKFPIQGKSIKLQSPSVSRLGPIKAGYLSVEKLSTKKECQPGLLETLVEQYRNISNCVTPEPLSPRIFKADPDKFKADSEKKDANDLRFCSPKLLGKSLEVRLSTRNEKRSSSTKSIRRIKRNRFRD